MALQLLPLTWRRFERLSSELHTYKDRQPGSAPPTHTAASFTLPSSFIICICHTSPTVLLHRARKVHLPVRDRFLLKLSLNFAWQEIDFVLCYFKVLEKNFRILVLRSRPQRVLAMASVYSQLGDTESHAIKIGKPGRTEDRHLIGSFYLGSQIFRN